MEAGLHFSVLAGGQAFRECRCFAVFRDVGCEVVGGRCFGSFRAPWRVLSGVCGFVWVVFHLRWHSTPVAVSIVIGSGRDP